MDILDQVKKFLSEAEVLSDKMHFDFEENQSVLIIKKISKESDSDIEHDLKKGFYLGEVEFGGNTYACLAIKTSSLESEV